MTIRAGLWMCATVMALHIGCIRSQCDPPNCELGDFLTPLDPDLVPNPNQTCYTEGSQLSLSCSGNYGGPPGPFTCTGGSWGSPSPSCDAWTCDPPTPAEDVIVSPEQTVYNPGEKVTYSCPGNKIIVGTADASCDEAGWNPLTTPTCTEVCDTPVIRNGNLTTDQQFKDTDTATVQCYPGYDLQAGDSTTITCVEGSWDQVPDCYGRCATPGVENSDKPDDGEIKHGETMTIECDTGHSYNQITDFTLACTDGVLSGETIPTQCFEDCDALTAPEDGGVTGGNLHGETATYSCDRGFLLNETETETCTNGNWSNGGVTPTCYDQTIENSISLVCEPAYFVVEIPLGLFSGGADETSVVMGGCLGTYASEEYIFLNSTYNECETSSEVESADQTLVYSNTVINADSEIVTTDQAIRINVECVFNQDNLVSSSAVVQDTLVKPVSADGEYSISFGVYSDNGYQEPITGEDTVSTDSDIFLKAQVNNIVDLDVYPTSCYATPYPDAEDFTTFYRLITDGMSVSDYATALGDADIDNKPTFSFASKAFRFSGDSGQTIYIHCDLKICPDETCLLPNTVRRRRSARSSQLTVSRHVFAGPIKTRNTREAEPESGWQSTALTVYSATLSVFVVCTIGVVALVQYRRRTTKIYQQI